MSAQILRFPTQDSYDKHQVSHVHKLAAELGHDPKQTVRDFIAAGCPSAPAAPACRPPPLALAMWALL